ncbi:MAG: FAD-dependent oxidoreductase [Enhygromyxa sp.]
MFDASNSLTFLERDPSSGKFDLVFHDPIAKGGQLCRRQRAGIRALSGGDVVIVGAGVGGLTVAYDLLKQNADRPADQRYRVTVVEAAGRVGGRSITLRPGDPNDPTPEDSFTEDFIDNNGQRQVITQTCTFEGADKPYLNAGPGRIPSGHIQLLHLCQELEVELELYVMETRSNLVATRTEGSASHDVRVNRQVANDIRGHIAADLYERLRGEQLERRRRGATPDPQVDRVMYLLRNFGALVKDESDESDAYPKYVYRGSQRAGFAVLPGTDPGILLEPIAMQALVDAKLWERSFYQAEDFLWQQTSFQPVGGMDMIEKRLEAKIRELSRQYHPRHQPILLNCPVTRIQKRGDQWAVTYRTGSGTGEVVAKYCVSNMPIPLLRDKLQRQDFSQNYWAALAKVMSADGFLRPTCKVGWQAERKLWQEPKDQHSVPIFGGISRVDHAMTQMWYPSNQWHAELGVLTGAYNYEDAAERWGKLLPKERIDEARAGAKILHGEEFAGKLRHGISIAWQNMPYLRGGWVDWEKVSSDPDERRDVMNAVRKGDNDFYIVGDQVSFLPGWKEGAVATALEVFARVCEVEDYLLPVLAEVPNTRELVEGHVY